MTTASEETVVVDSDFNPDDHQHACCAVCYPPPPIGTHKPGDLIRTLCGATVALLPNQPGSHCPRCLAMTFEPWVCPVCGAVN